MMKSFLVLLGLLIGELGMTATQPIAHRGASGYAPENTIAAVKKALELNIKYIEIDVHMTKDGEVVALHDSTIDRTSNGRGNIKDFNLSKLKEFDFGSWFNHNFKNERLPTLKEVLKLTSGRATLIIELKYGNDHYPQIEKKITELVKSLNLEKQVIYKSFSYKILNEFEKLAPNIARLYCTFWGNEWITIDNFFRFKSIFEKANFSYLQVHKYFLSKSLIDMAHSKGIKVVVWDVHDKGAMRKFTKLGVDFIESDFPDYVLNIKY